MIDVQTIRPDTHSPDDIMKHLSADGWEDEGHTEDRSNLQKFIENPDSYLLLAFVDGEVAGMLTAFVHCKIDERGQEMYVDEVETIQAFRKQGVGKAMMTEITRIARERSCSEVWVITETDNIPARALYNSLKPAEANGSIVYVFPLR